MRLRLHHDRAKALIVNLDVGAGGHEHVAMETDSKHPIEMRKRGIDFTVVLNPYEAQLRKSNGGVDFGPQERIENYLSTKGIRTIDTGRKFVNLERPSEAFLFADPMHLSAKGHSLVFETLVEDRQSHGDHLQ